MTVPVAETGKPRVERSPSFPFIPLSKAIHRAKTMEERHKREAARVPMLANTWGYGAKSSGLAQTVGALIQFGLADDTGSGAERKIQLTDLARRILFDTRPGVRTQGLKEAALKPRLIGEMHAKWGTDRPSDEHCVSELVFDWGFNEVAARTFLRTYDETISFAGLKDGDTLSPSQEEETPVETPAEASVVPAPSVKTAIGRAVGVSHARATESQSLKRSTLALPEGVVAIDLPAAPLSKASHSKLAKWLELIVEFADIEEGEAATS